MAKVRTERLLTTGEVGHLLRIKKLDVIVGMCHRGEFPGAFRLAGAKSQWRIPEAAVRSYCAARVAETQRLMPRKRRGQPYEPSAQAAEAPRLREDEDQDPDGNVLEQG